MVLEPSIKTGQQLLKRRRRFWVGPLVAGVCFSLGYGVTYRVMNLRLIFHQIQPESFAYKAVSGVGLESLRLLHGGDRAELLPNLSFLNSQSSEKHQQIRSIQEKELIKKQAQLDIQDDTKTVKRPDRRLRDPRVGTSFLQDLQALPISPIFPEPNTFSLPEEFLPAP